MRALRDMNLPKFVFEDVPLFLGLISDLFPGLDCPRVRYPSFNDAVEEVLQENKYVTLPNQVTQRLSSYSGKDECLGVDVHSNLSAVCGFRWIKWCRCMRPWWPGTPLWLWARQVEGNRLWSARCVKLRQSQFTSLNFSPPSWFFVWTKVIFILSHCHQIGIANQDASPEPESHECQWTLRYSGPRHSRLDWWDLIQHLPWHQQADWQERAEVKRWLWCSTCQLCHSFIHSYVKKYIWLTGTSCSMGMWMLCGLRIWTQWWMTTSSSLWPMENASAYRVTAPCCSRFVWISTFPYTFLQLSNQ